MAENQAGPAAELSSCRYGTLEMFYTMVIFSIAQIGLLIALDIYVFLLHKYRVLL